MAKSKFRRPRPKPKPKPKPTNWKEPAALLGGAGLLTWILVDDNADDKIGGFAGSIGNFISSLFGGLFEGLMPLLCSSSSLACVIFIFMSMFTAASGKLS